MHTHNQSALRWVLVFAALVLTPRATAQDAVMAAPESKLTAPALRDTGPKSLSQPAEPTGAFFQFGPLSLHPHLMARAVYGMGLPSNDGRHVASMIYTQSPGLRVDVGQQWTFDYTPTWTAYTARAMDDTVDHSARLSGAWMMQDWAVTFSENYRKSSPLLIETGGQTPQRTWATALGAGRSFGTGLNFQTSASLDERYGETFPDTRDWATMNWLTIQFSPRLNTGLGFGAGYSDIVGQPDATNERYMARFNWSPTDKLSLAVDAGMEARHSRAADAKDMNNPIVNASLMYRPFEVTQVAFSATRSTTNSYYENQVTESAGWNVSINQRLLRHFFFSTTYGRQETDNTAIVASAPVDPALVSPPGRSDRTESLNLRLTTQILERWTLAASYQRTRSDSNLPGFAFTTTQFGIEVGVRF